ncbi:MAG TPA: hypothetical protein VI749_09190 [Candidatus Omnitrophota bacterium]|nr:hypothetical protein [Candidatus Omnitrophota bacterium]
MSKAAKLSIIILIALLVVSLGYAGYVLTQKSTLEEEKAALQGDLDQAVDREKKNLIKMRGLEDSAKTLDEELRKEKGLSETLRKQITEAQAQADSIKKSLDEKISRLSSESESWKNRIDRITKERDELLVKLQNIPPPQPVVKEEPKPEPRSTVTAPLDADEEYWAQLLKEKAALEIEVEKLNEKISQDSLKTVELKQRNQELEMKISALESEQGIIEEDIRGKEEMVDRLSIELARTKNDKKYETTQTAKLKEENTDLRRQLRDAVSAKNALEKSIIRLTQDKVTMEKKVNQTETLIQSKIDEIWEIKDSLDESIQQSKVEPQTGNEVELPPIVVKTKGQAVNYTPGATHAGFNGTVVSINDENNFVIVDIGEVQGLRLGDALSVYRDSKYIARLEVIQVRKDIAAADIKDQWSKVRVGDVIR